MYLGTSLLLNFFQDGGSRPFALSFLQRHKPTQKKDATAVLCAKIIVQSKFLSDLNESIAQQTKYTSRLIYTLISFRLKKLFILALHYLKMKTIEIRKKLIEKINSSSNKNLLQEMYNFLCNDSTTDDLYKLSRIQKIAINKGREQIKNGKSFTNDEVNFEIDKWLKEK